MDAVLLVKLKNCGLVFQLLLQITVLVQNQFALSTVLMVLMSIWLLTKESHVMMEIILTMMDAINGAKLKQVGHVAEALQ
jgi:hypothetical protein